MCALFVFPFGSRFVTMGQARLCARSGLLDVITSLSNYPPLPPTTPSPHRRLLSQAGSPTVMLRPREPHDKSIFMSMKTDKTKCNNKPQHQYANRKNK